MFINKNKYYIYIENLRSINLDLVKIRNKFNLIYRNSLKKESLNDMIDFIRRCKKKNIKLFIANDLNYAVKTGANGIYLSSYNKAIIKKKKLLLNKFEIIGSAHNFKEIGIKIKQGCEKIILSRLFKTEYKNKKSFYGTTRFNLLTKNYDNDFVALGGIRSIGAMPIPVSR